MTTSADPNRQNRPQGNMTGGRALAEMLRLSGVGPMFGMGGFQLLPFYDALGQLGMRHFLINDERCGAFAADAYARVTNRPGICDGTLGPGATNLVTGLVESLNGGIPVVSIAGDTNRAHSWKNMTQECRQAEILKPAVKELIRVEMTSRVPELVRRAFAVATSGRPGPVLIEFPADVLREDMTQPLVYERTPRVKSAPDSHSISEIAAALVAAERPVIYAGQGVHYAKAWKQLRALAELLEAPVTTSLGGKSAFPESHPLALGSGGVAISKQLHHALQSADLILGIGCSFTRTNFAVPMPKGKRIAHITLDAMDINKDVPVALAAVGDAGLALDALCEEVKDRLHGRPRGRLAAVTGEIRGIREEWMAQWMPRLTANTTPLSPYRVIWDLLHTVDVANTIITHDAGSPRDQLSPFWVTEAPLSYLGWGKTTQLGYGLGLAMGAKLAAPDKLCINVWGDAAIGFTGMDFETAVRERIPIMSILLNNFSMAIELKVMPISTEKYRSTDISGDYAAMARAFGGYGERVTKPEDIIPAIKRGIQKTREGIPVLLEFITSKETEVSRPGT
jgi:acetolactate synthase-1/2/3 large subunit